MNVILTLGEFALAVGAILGLFGLFVKYAILIPIKAYIDQKTYPIQPHANGGKSLPDVALGIEAIKIRLDGIERRVMRLEDTPKN
jgi:hypothetical protein